VKDHPGSCYAHPKSMEAHTGAFDTNPEAMKVQIQLNSNVKSSIVEERMHSFLFIRSIVQERLYMFH
jgi:hypothetical protein